MHGQSRAPRILHFTGMGCMKFGALEQYLLALVSRCQDLGWQTVLQYNEPVRSPAYREALQRLGVQVVIADMRRSPAAAALILARLLRAVRPRIVHSHFLNDYVHLAVPRLAKWAGGRRILTTVHMMRSGARFLPRRLAYAGYDHLLCVSDAVAESLRSAGIAPRRIATLYLGLCGARRPSPAERDTWRAQLGMTQESIVIGCIAFDTPLKGVDILLHAFKLVRQRFPSVQLVIVGIDPARSALPHLAAELGVADATHWPGIQDEGWRLLQAVDLYAQPSRTEGLPLAVLEAMALELPVVGTGRRARGGGPRWSDRVRRSRGVAGGCRRGPRAPASQRGAPEGIRCRRQGTRPTGLCG